MAYMGGNSVFGIINLSDGQFTQLGGALQYAGLGELNGTLYTINNVDHSLYTVNPVNGSVTLVGSTGVATEILGSTTSGLYVLDNYAVDGSLHLYLINPTTGAATLIGPTGLTTPDGDLGLSTGSDTLYMNIGDPAAGYPNLLYSLSTTTGFATLIGATGIGAVGTTVFENGVLYGVVDDSPFSLCTLNTSTGAGTIGAPTPYTIGLAPVFGATLTPTKLAFGAQLVGTTSPLKTATLTNLGTSMLDIFSIETAGEFEESNACPSSLAPGANCAIDVTFKPAAKGSQTSKLLVSDSAPNSPQTVSLSGAGTYVQLTPARLNFGKQAVGTESAAQTVTLTNTNAAVLIIMGISITNKLRRLFRDQHLR